VEGGTGTSVFVRYLAISNYSRQQAKDMTLSFVVGDPKIDKWLDYDEKSVFSVGIYLC
jgi:hypothetical protein